MSHESIESTIAPRSAGTNPATAKPGTTNVIAQKRSAFNTKEKSPKVIIVMGRVSIERTGLMTMLMTDNTSATSRIVIHQPETAMPGTRLTVRYTAATVPR